MFYNRRGSIGPCSALWQCSDKLHRAVWGGWDPCIDSKLVGWTKRAFYYCNMGTLLSWEQYNDPLSLSCAVEFVHVLWTYWLGSPGGDPEAIDSVGLESETVSQRKMECPQCPSLAVPVYIPWNRVLLLSCSPNAVFNPLQDSSRQQSLASESTVARLEQKILTIKAEQEAVLSSMSEEVDAACCSLLKNGQRNLKVFIYMLFILCWVMKLIQIRSQYKQLLLRGWDQHIQDVNRS